MTPAALTTQYIKQGACNACVDRFDAGGGAAGYVEVYDGAVLAVTFTLPNPAFGAATLADPSVATCNGLPIAAVAVADVPAADNYIAYDTAGVAIGTGTVSVTGGAGEVQLDNVIIAAGQTITITAFTVTQP